MARKLSMTALATLAHMDQASYRTITVLRTSKAGEFRAYIPTWFPESRTVPMPTFRLLRRMGLIELGGEFVVGTDSTGAPNLYSADYRITPAGHEALGATQTA